MKRWLLLPFIALVLLGCGIQTSLPGVSTPLPAPDPQTGDQIVYVAKVSYTPGGAQVTCNINPVLLDENLAISVFTEFNGNEVERITKTNSADYEFNLFTPEINGELRCVVNYASAEFESSATYILKDQILSNGAAALIFTPEGGVVTWGGQVSGGDSTDQTGVSGAAGILADGNNNGISDLLESGVEKIVGLHGDPEYGSTNSFAALKTNGSVVTWGYNLHGGDATGMSSPPANIKILADSNSDAVADVLSSKVKDVFFSIFSFAALKNNGSIITWGDNERGGDATGSTSPGANIKTLTDGNSDGIADLLSSGVQRVEGSVYAYAALKNNGSVITWGDGGNGGDATGTTTATNHSLADANSNGIADLLESQVVSITPGRYSFSALKSNGSVVSWGHRRWGGDQTGVSGDAQAMPLNDLNANGIGDLLESGVEKIFTTYRAYCALKNDGSIVTWGEDNEGGDSTHAMSNGGYGYLPDLNANGVADLLESGVVNVYRTRGAFAALKNDGSLVVWGRNNRGGDPTGVSGPAASVKVLTDVNSDFIADELASGIVKVFSNRDAFAAVKANGSVVSWGGVSRGGDPINAAAVGNVGSLPDNNSNGVADALESGVDYVIGSEHALAALKSDGSVVAWGSADKGGDPTCAQSPAGVKCLADTNSNGIADVLESGVVNLIGMQYPGFIAVKENGEIITWGETTYGGDIFNEGARNDIGYLEDLNGNLIPDLLE